MNAALRACLKLSIRFKDDILEICGPDPADVEHAHRDPDNVFSRWITCTRHSIGLTRSLSPRPLPYRSYRDSCCTLTILTCAIEYRGMKTGDYSNARQRSQTRNRHRSLHRVYNHSPRTETEAADSSKMREGRG